MAYMLVIWLYESDPSTPGKSDARASMPGLSHAPKRVARELLDAQ
jgi:hypothetical protein